MQIPTWLGGGRAPRPAQIKSPFSEGELEKFVYSDIYGVDYAPLTRADVLAIPAFSKAHDLLCDAVGKLTLIAANKAGVIADEDQPLWLYRTEGAISPYLRLSWTCDDLLIYGHSLWGVRRGARQGDAALGPILAAWRIDYGDWGINEAGFIYRKSNGKIYDDSEFIYIPSHTAGVIDRSGSTLRAAINIGKAVEFRARTPIPVMEINLTDEPAPGEAKKLIKQYSLARLDPDGATMVTPPGVTLVPHGDRADSGFMVEARNSVRLDMGNITGVPASLLDGSTATATLTYSTADGKKTEFQDFAVSPFILSITGRLSQDDCVARGTRVEADLTNVVAARTTPIDETRQD